MTSTSKRDARTVSTWLDRPRGARRIPTPDEAYEAGRRLLAALGEEPSVAPWTATAMRADLERAGVRL